MGEANRENKADVNKLKAIREMKRNEWKCTKKRQQGRRSEKKRGSRRKRRRLLEGSEERKER